jgi:hypothetical protein
MWPAAIVIALAIDATSAIAAPGGVAKAAIEIETGAAWQTRNDVRIPGDTGTPFAFDDLTGSGPYGFVRLNATWDLSYRHGLRFVLAPFSVTESGTLPNRVAFAGGVFDADVPTEGTYRFNSYRVSYRYRLHDGARWRWWIGATLKVRDAKIELQQLGTSAEKSDLGLVPLLYAAGEGRIGQRWRFVLDFDGLAAPQGRAFDLALKMIRELPKGWSVGAGYRTLEGGADNDEVYNFAWLHYALVSVARRF